LDTLEKRGSSTHTLGFRTGQDRHGPLYLLLDSIDAILALNASVSSDFLTKENEAGE
jgi:hypothetical protein